MHDQPHILGSYEVVKKIGEGGFGLVYLGVHTILGRKTALKLFKKERISPHRMSEFKNRFVREAKILAALDHEYIVKLYDFFYTESGPCIAMEYVQGRSLSEFDLTRLKAKRKLAYFIAVLQGMAAVHDQEIVHRDLKLANILVAEETDKVKITDFGIAFQMDTELAEKDFNHLIGTWQYMSPEQVLGQKLDIYSDIWSLGVVLYRLFTNRLPFPGKDKKQLRRAICRGKYTPPSQIARVPEDLDGIIKHCLQLKKSDRYQSCREILRDINSLL